MSTKTRVAYDTINLFKSSPHRPRELPIGRDAEYKARYRNLPPAVVRKLRYHNDRNQF
jgi:hypothetical protein